jgi:hypothetical protein
MGTTTTALLHKTFGVFTATTLLLASCGVEPDTMQVMSSFRRPRPPARPAGIRRPKR